MALDSPDQIGKLTQIVSTGNYDFTSIFTAKAILQIIAMTPIKLLNDG